MKRHRFTRKERLEELKSFVALCFATLDENDLKELANATRLSVSTLYRLRSGEFTLNVRFGTIQSLGLVAGFTLVESEHGYAMGVIS